MRIACFYDLAPGALGKVRDHYEAHTARLKEFHGRGVLLAAGPLGTPPEGALAIFTTREAADDFIQGDPFVINGLVKRTRMVPWDAAFL